ncbi:MAG TPA: acyl-CoA dehydrogenase family protein [Chitinophagaceae bacterium]|nr:acyl-CoA dehydrogenase family protein [Chitinophagaceae bacterium]
MESAKSAQAALKGGEFLVRASGPFDQFIPEDFSEEQLMIRDVAAQFIVTEVHPVIDRIDRLEPGLMVSLLEKAGAQGLLGASFPEQYGGMGKDFITSTLINEVMGSGNSFSVAMAAHTGIGTLPILYFGTDIQKEKYIPGLASGALKGAYALTEPNSGSDALSAKTTARLDGSGTHYLINGQKCWITNSGFADIFTVFAKIDGDKFTAFIVEKGTPGLSLGEEEHKMGIKGSSTRQVFFQDCRVPVENVLGEIGKGHLIAFNILNIGRLKLCAAALGASKYVADITVRYANTREQFGHPIAFFGALQHKIAEQAVRIFSCESALYRVAQLIDRKEQDLLHSGKSFGDALLGAAEEYAIECAILKINGSEVLDYVVDEGVQVHGGNGFSDEYEISRAYRDSRINRIFEGTNEINRLLIMDMLLKRTNKGKIDLMGPAIGVQQELMNIPEMNTDERMFASEQTLISGIKKAILMVAGAAVQKLGPQLETQQELLMNISDMIITVFLAESSLFRVMKMADQRGMDPVKWQIDLMRVFLSDSVTLVTKAAQDAINAFLQGDEQRMMLSGLKRFTRTEPYNTQAARRRIAEKLITENRYCF